MIRRLHDVLFLAGAATTTVVVIAACQGQEVAAAQEPQKVATTQDHQEVLAPQESVEARAWEHESSDLPVDSRLHFGAFDSGLRWVWAKNAEPKFRSYLRLHVNVGSLAEEDSERGMAHFLEHMA